MSLLSTRVTGLCEHCVSGFELPGTPTGKEVLIGGRTAYVASAPASAAVNAPATSANAIVLLTDIFGLPGGNNQLIADELAEKLSMDVYVPDVYDGEPFRVLEPCHLYLSTDIVDSIRCCTDSLSRTARKFAQRGRHSSTRPPSTRESSSIT
jgi:hypothetical protein